eukprot:Skav232311  [mRNA]  locus=scaffold882:683070:683504:+ [translate_table: standard]
MSTQQRQHFARHGAQLDCQQSVASIRTSQGEDSCQLHSLRHWHFIGVSELVMDPALVPWQHIRGTQGNALVAEELTASWVHQPALQVVKPRRIHGEVFVESFPTCHTKTTQKEGIAVTTGPREPAAIAYFETPSRDRSLIIIWM